MIDRVTVDKIMEAADIVEVVSEFVSLRKAGVNYKGLCPFHNEKTPSFVVSPSKGFCHCFSCGKGGNVVGFLMEHEQFTYPDALRWLARKYHIEIQERELTDKEKLEENARESMFIVNEWAVNYFQDILHNNVDGKAIGMQYFRSRGFRDDIINKFQLGYALPQRDALAKAAVAKGYQPEFLVSTGLCFRRDDGQLVDKFSGRVMFPWLNVSGKVSAFGGRLLDSRTKGVNQKYMNSPDSVIYHKDHELYGLYQAKRAITKEDRVFLVEGYTDVISMHQCGIENVVANSGTALSMPQIRALHRFTSNIVLLYDGDAAGIHAAMRGTDMLLGEGMNIKMLLLPDGDDPDSFARKHDAAEFTAYIEKHQTDFIEFKTHLLIDGVTDPIKRSAAISSIVKSISVIPDAILRDTYVHECSAMLDVPERTLISAMNKYIRADKDEKIKEVERERAKQERAMETGDVTPQPSDSSNDEGKYAAPVRPLVEMPNSAANVSAELERLLIQVVVRHGEEIIFDKVETEDDSETQLSVARLVKYSLSEDELSFSTDVYNRILNEVVDHEGEEGFRAETFLMHHPDVAISTMSTQLAIHHYQLSKSQQMEYNEKDLRNTVLHLIYDYKLDYVDRQLKEVRKQMAAAGKDLPRVMALMQNYKQIQAMRDAIVKKLGGSIRVSL